MFDFNQITPYRDGKAGFIAGLAQQIGVDHIFNTALEKHSGRPADIPYGSLAQMMLINMADEHHPLSRLGEYFETVDLESLLGHSVDNTQLNDDRFGGFLDAMHEYGLSKLLSEVSVAAFKRYGIKLTNVNFDTTSKVMWGEYKTENGTLESLEITFGYSKQKRFDKKQIMFSLGTTQGIAFEGQVLSGNTSDKRFNIDNLERAQNMRSQFDHDGDDFFYIADSAAFTEEMLIKAKSMDIDVITRMTDQVKETKTAIEKVAIQLDSLPTVEIETSTVPSVYKLLEDTCEYKGVPLKLACCYSEKLRPTKEKTILRQVDKERIQLEKTLASLQKRTFACEEDARLEIDKFACKDGKKLKYHSVQQRIRSQVKRPVGRPKKDADLSDYTTVYVVESFFEVNPDAIEKRITRECIFVVSSTNLDMSAESILREYKSQSAVERKFQFLKSPQFVNSFYVNSPSRVEAIGYLMLILMVLLSVAEHVVRRELEKDKAIIIGPGKVKMKRPSLIAIYRIFYSVQTAAILISGRKQRGFTKPLAKNVETVLKYLEIPESIYIRGDSRV